MPSVRQQIAKELGITAAYPSYMVNGKRPWRPDLYDRDCRLVNKTVNRSSKSGRGVGTRI